MIADNNPAMTPPCQGPVMGTRKQRLSAGKITSDVVEKKPSKAESETHPF